MLLAFLKMFSFENQKQAEKGLYVRTIMPEANEWIGGIDYDLRGKDRQTRIIADYFYLPIFEDDLKTKSEAKRTAITNLSLLLQDKQITQSEYRFELQKLGFGDGKEIPPPADDNQSDVETLAAQAQLRGWDARKKQPKKNLLCRTNQSTKCLLMCR